MPAEGLAGILKCHNSFEHGAYRPCLTCPNPLGYFPALWTRVQSWGLNHTWGSIAPALQGAEKWAVTQVSLGDSGIDGEGCKGEECWLVRGSSETFQLLYQFTNPTLKPEASQGQF